MLFVGFSHYSARLFFLFLAFGLFFGIKLSAQRNEKALEQLDQAFLTGDARLISRYYKKVNRKSVNRILNIQDSMRFLYAEARFARWMGDLQSSEKFAGILLQKGKTRLGENAPFYQDFLIRRAQISFEGGDYIVCGETLGNFFSLCRKYPVSDSDMVFRARFLQVKNAVEMGALGEASNLIEKLVAKAENRMRERKEVRNGDKVSYADLNERDLRRRRHDWLWTRVLKARYLRERGDMKEAGEELKQLVSFCRKYNIKEEDQAYIEYRFEQCRYDFANGSQDDAILNLRKNLLWFSRREYAHAYTKTHDQYLYGIELLISFYHAVNDPARTRDYELAFRRIIRKRMPETAANSARLIIPLGAIFDIKNDKLAEEMEIASREMIANALPVRYSGRIFDFLVKYNIRKNNIAKAEQILRQQTDYLKLRLGETSYHYHIKRCELGQYFARFTNNLDEAEKIFRESLHENLLNQLSEKSPDLINAWNGEGLYFSLTNQFQLALNNYTHVLQILEREYGRQSREVAVQLYRIADIQSSIGEFASAEAKFLAAVSVLKKEKTLDYSESERLLARLYIITGRFEEADRHLSRSLAVELKKGGSMLKFNGMDDEIMLLIYKGLFLEAKEKTDELVQTKVDFLKTKKHRLLVTPYQLAAQVYSATGDYSNAEEFGLLACESSKLAYGDISMPYFKSLGILSRVHSSYGDYDRALEMASKSYKGICDNFGSKHPEAAQPLIDIAMVWLQKGIEKNKILKNLREAAGIVKNTFGADNPKYAESLQYLASFYLQSGNWLDAGPVLDTADAIWKDRLGKENVHSAEILLLRADIDSHFGRIGASRKSLEKAAEIFSEIFDKIHPRYLEILPRISQSYFMEGKESDAISYARESCKANLTYIKKFFPSMADREKSRMWNTMKNGFEYFYTLGCTYYKDRPELLREMFEVILKTKAILLSSSIQVRQRILNSDDLLLKSKYLAWLKKKEDITAAIELSPDTRLQDGLDIRKLESEADQLEEELSTRSEEFKKARKENEIGLAAVKSKLKPNELAIEMVRFRYFSKTFTDSIIYAALITDADPAKNPEIILFPNGSRMEGSYSRYYRKSVRLQLPDTLSYTIFWKPLQKYFPKGGRVFFSPDGVYNEINPEGLLKSGRKYVIEEDNVILVASTRDLIEKSAAQKNQSKSKSQALLIGNPDFYGDNQTTGTKRKIEHLPGTKQEIELIYEELTKNNWDVLKLTGSHAKEVSLKNKTIKPRVMHIATHGFFMEAPKAYFLETAYSLLNRNALIDNPLLRSGLYLSDAGTVVENIEESSDALHAGDGIFSSMEALNLDLNSTELVVLSACETGRGDMKVGDGIYGLHRAFQIAGSGSVIMSLFKVSDEATQQLMSIFYRKWISEKKNIRTAFTEAKLDLKKQYPHPLYWASFVLVGDY